MSSNITARSEYNVIGFYIIALFSFLCIAVSILLCLIILLIIYLTRTLHTPANLLLCDTCLCALLYSIMSVINDIHLYTNSISTDWSCRVRGYLAYVTLSLVVHSYVIQAVSRLFWTVLYRYRHLLTNRCHIYLIIFHFGLSFLIPLSTIVTKDIVFRPFSACYVSVSNRIHIFYLLIIGYILPVLIVIILYIIIYRHSTHSAPNIQRVSLNNKRDRDLARNILILLGIFLFGGLPTIIYITLSNRLSNIPSLLYMVAGGAPSIALAVEKAVTILLNKDIRKAIHQRWIARTARVRPFQTAKDSQRRTNLN